MLPAHQQFYRENGYVVVEGLFGSEEVSSYRTHFMELRQRQHEGDFVGVDSADNDPLKQYPRMIHMHRWDTVSLEWMTEPRLNQILTGLLGREPYAVQTMLYFKPPGARGQALHQDNYYLRVQPGTCMAAWLALDDCDEANGCMQVVPGSHDWPLLCPVEADTSQSFTDVTVPLTPDLEVRPVIMKAGDVLFFNGQLIHGSYPNTTADRFRRSLIGHYIEGAAQAVGRWYHPALRMDRSPLELAPSPGSTECGVWVEKDGTPSIEVGHSVVVEAALHD